MRRIYFASLKSKHRLRGRG